MPSLGIMLYKKIDFFLIFVSFLFILVSGYKLFFEDYKLGFDNPAHSLPMAKVKGKLNTVKKKSDQFIAWIDAKTDEELFSNDQVYTHNNSQVDLVFEDKSEIKLSENTLIKIELNNKKTGLNLEKGTVYAKLTSGTSGFNLSSQGKEISITSDNAEIQIEHNTAGVRVGVVSGEVKIEGQNESIFLKEDQFLDFQKGKKKAILGEKSFSLKTPTYNQQIYFIDKANVRFSWKAKESPPFVHLVVAADNKFEKIIFNEQITQSFFKYGNLSAGSFYWKVYSLGQNQQKIESDVRSFSLIEDLPPQLIGPINKAEFSQEDVSSEVYLEWRNELPANSFEVIVQLGNRTLLKKIVKNTFLFLQNLQVGAYHWRVRVIDELRPHSPWSPAFSFIMLKKIVLPLPAPSLISPEPNETIISHRLSEIPVEFRWQKVDDLDSYLIIVAKDNEMKEKIKEQQMTGNSFSWMAPDPGVYYWQVKAVTSESKREGTFSSPQSVNLQRPPPPPKPELPSNYNLKIEMKQKGEKSTTSEEPPLSQLLRWMVNWPFAVAYAEDFVQMVTLKWDSIESAQNYIVEIYKDEDGKELILQVEVEGKTFYEWMGPHPGKYFFRIAGIDLWKRQGPFSDMSTLSIELPEDLRKLDKVELNSPKHQKSFIRQEEDSIPFEWEKSSKIKEYKIEISQSKDFEKLLYSKKTKENSATIDLKVFKGVPAIFWKITAIDHYNRETKSLKRKVLFEDKKEEPSGEEMEKEKLNQKENLLTRKMEDWIPHNQSYLGFSLTPGMVDYQLTQNTLKVAIDGLVLNSVLLNYLQYFGPTIFTQASLERQSAKSFTSLPFQSMQAGFSIGYHFLLSNQSSWQLEGEYLWSQKSLYSKDTAITLKEEKKTFSSINAQGTYLYSSSTHLIHAFSFGYAIGSFQKMNLSYGFRYLKLENLMLMGGPSINKGDLKNGTTQVEFLEIQLNIGIGYLL